MRKMKAVCKIWMKWLDDWWEVEMSGRRRHEGDAEQQKTTPFRNHNGVDDGNKQLFNASAWVREAPKGFIYWGNCGWSKDLLVS